MRINKCIAIASIFVILSSLCVCVYADDLTGLQNQSNELSGQITETNNRLKVVQEELSENMQGLQELDAQIAQSQEEIININQQVDTLKQQIQENEEKLNETQQKVDKMQSLVDARLIAMYEAPKLQYLEIILTSESFTEMLSNYYNIKQLIEYDSELLKTVENQRKEIETTKKILAEKKQQIVTEKQTQQKKAQVLANIKTMREYYVSKLTKEEQELQTQIDEYNSQVSEIEAEIRLLALNSIGPDYIGGAMGWPVPGYTALTSLYGMRVHPITKAYKLHTGVDISAPMGANFVASADGIVTKATFNKAYGNMVIIDHGGGVQTLYAHGSEILVQAGQQVTKGTEILKVGSTGYSTGPHAHFEIRINGQTVNPLDYLLNLNKQPGEKSDNQDEANTEKN